ncbi:helix-turn-helix domain-containing protein [Neglectibacter caecimuris]|uniref:helix-turn-helix domain-containing protein n=1 Tax=Neglectibacter caecimuris TaxID=3093658 RepID=UPI002AC955C7|nr:helix-turn-helix transcriptional regulator [Neglectibacter sp. M00184]
MAVSYKKLWHILLDRDMKKKELAELAGLSPYTIKKMGRDEAVSTEVVGKICRALECNLDDVVEYIPTEENVKANQ